MAHIYSLSRGRQISEFKPSLVYSSEFQNRQGYIEEIMPWKTKHKQTNQ